MTEDHLQQTTFVIDNIQGDRGHVYRVGKDPDGIYLEDPSHPIRWFKIVDGETHFFTSPYPLLFGRIYINHQGKYKKEFLSRLSPIEFKKVLL